MVNLLTLVLDLIRANDIVDGILSNFLDVFRIEFELVFKICHLLV